MSTEHKCPSCGSQLVEVDQIVNNKVFRCPDKKCLVSLPINTLYETNPWPIPKSIPGEYFFGRKD